MYAPMLATAGSIVDVATRHAIEFKWDGVRALVHAEAAGFRVLARSGNDISGRYPELDGLHAVLPTGTVLDGEVIALGDDGRPSFHALQGRMHLTGAARVEAARRESPVVLMVFDILRLGADLVTDRPYEERRELLAGLGLADRHWQVPGHHLDADPTTMLQVAATNGLEGIVGKRLGSPYRAGTRSRDWIKIRLTRRQEFVVGGWHHGQGGRSGTFGSLLVGYWTDDPASGGTLRYAGNVGSGFTADELERLHAQLDPTVRDASPFDGPVRDEGAATTTYVEPRLVVEVRFSEWTPLATLRAPVYLGQRDDKPAVAVRRETIDGVDL